MIGLHDAIKRFDAAIRGEIVYLGLEWPSFSNLLGAWAEYRNLIESIHRPQMLTLSSEDFKESFFF